MAEIPLHELYEYARSGVNVKGRFQEFGHERPVYRGILSVGPCASGLPNYIRVVYLAFNLETGEPLAEETELHRDTPIEIEST